MTREEMLNKIIELYGADSKTAYFFTNLIDCETNDWNDECIGITYEMLISKKN